MNDTDKPLESKKSSSKKPSKNRRKSRELALKAIYQHLISPSELTKLLSNATEDGEFQHADEGYFKTLTTGVYHTLAELDTSIAAFVDRPMHELSPVEHAVLCISSYELLHDASIPYRVAINEGVELAKIYGGTDGHKYVNGVLDKIAENARPQEFGQAGKSSKP